MIDYKRLYEYRFRGIDQKARQRVWDVISPDIHARMGFPRIVLDPAAGRCEFINAVGADEKWICDQTDPVDYRRADTRVIIADIFDAELPSGYFDGVFVSNFLEHLPTQDSVADFLAKMYAVMQPGGRIAVMGPNFKFCASEYFDCADHTLALTHVSIDEHLHAAGFAVSAVLPRYLPYSFRGVLPPSPLLTRKYLRYPVVHRILGKQFLLIAERPM